MSVIVVLSLKFVFKTIWEIVFDKLCQLLLILADITKRYFICEANHSDFEINC